MYFLQFLSLFCTCLFCDNQHLLLCFWSFNVLLTFAFSSALVGNTAYMCVFTTNDMTLLGQALGRSRGSAGYLKKIEQLSFLAPTQLSEEETDRRGLCLPDPEFPGSYPGSCSCIVSLPFSASLSASVITVVSSFWVPLEEKWAFNFSCSSITLSFSWPIFCHSTIILELNKPVKFAQVNPCFWDTDHDVTCQVTEWCTNTSNLTGILFGQEHPAPDTQLR